MWVEGWGILPGQLIVVSGPSGSGKSSVIRRVLGSPGLNVQLSVSATTRAPRPGEDDGVHYSFLDRDEFLAARDAGGFLECAEYNGKFYGTPTAPALEAMQAGISVLLEIEVQGALQVRERAPTALFVFFRTPVFRDLETRLRERGTEEESVIHRRLRTARRELGEAHWYDHQIVNDDFETCVQDFTKLLKTYGCGG